MQSNPNKFSFEVNTFDILLTLLDPIIPEGYHPELADKKLIQNLFFYALAYVESKEDPSCILDRNNLEECRQ